MDLTYSDIDALIDNIANQIKDLPIQAIYGIPRGGLIPAILLSKKTNIPLLENLHTSSFVPKKDVFVLLLDDIEDSGNTIMRYCGKFEERGIIPILAVLVTKKNNFYARTWAKSVDKGVWVNFPWEDTGIEKEGIQDNIVRILQYIGEDPKRQGLLDTPKRVQKAYQEFFAGYKQDPKEILAKEFETSYDQMVVLKNIEFFSLCEHHMLPFFGTVSIAYIPVDKVVGISKLARLVEVYARRLQIQEQMTDQIANAIQENLHPQGVAVKVTAKHFCMITRGVEKQNSEMVTTRVLGAFREDSKARQEFLQVTQE